MDLHLPKAAVLQIVEDPGQGQDLVRGQGQGLRVPKVLVQGEFTI